MHSIYTLGYKIICRSPNNFRLPVPGPRHEEAAVVAEGAGSYVSLVSFQDHHQSHINLEKNPFITVYRA